MKTQKYVRIIHQIDEHQEFWLLDGIGKAAGKPLTEKGFTWISGPDGGCWQAPSRAALEPIISQGAPVLENDFRGKNA